MPAISPRGPSDIDCGDALADEVEAYRDESQAAADHWQGQGADEKLAELGAAVEMQDERAVLAAA